MKWCCPGFEGNFQNRNKSGFFVFARPPEKVISKEPLFYIASRFVENENKNNFSKAIKSLEFPVTLSVSTGMQYCPWCGVKLIKFYKKSYEALVDSKIIKELDLI